MPKVISLSVSADKFADDFQPKLSKALSDAFGSDVSVKFEEEMSDEDKKKKEDEAKAETEKMTQKVNALSTELEGKKADVARLTQELEQAKGKYSAQSTEIQQLTSSVKTLTDNVATLTKNYNESREALMKAQSEKEAQEISEFMTRMEAAGKITPATRAYTENLLKSADRAKVQKFSVDGADKSMTQFDMVKASIENGPDLVNFGTVSPHRQFTASDNDMSVKDGQTRVGEDAHQRALKYSKEHNVPYDAALIEVEKASGKAIAV